MKFTVNYYEYINSLDWMVKALAAKERADWECQRCGSDGPLETHHRTYARLGHEADEDLEVLCDECHEAEHRRLSRTPKAQMYLPFLWNTKDKQARG